MESVVVMPKDRANDPNRQAKPRELLTRAEVAAKFSVNPKTVSRWHDSGQLQAMRTLGGHRRFYKDEVEKLANPKADNND
jgi:excisionase family DNA binding protein